jgi:hypothetical protein
MVASRGNFVLVATFATDATWESGVGLERTLVKVFVAAAKMHQQGKKLASTPWIWKSLCLRLVESIAQLEPSDILLGAVLLAGTFGEKEVAKMEKIAIAVTCAIGHVFRKQMIAGLRFCESRPMLSC